MSVLISCATGNFTTAGTWALVDSTSYSNSETTNVALLTSYTTSSTFTPGAITIDGIAVKLAIRVGTTGTMTIALDQATADVAGTVVTINCSDLPVAASSTLEGGWIFFKFAAPVTLAGATAYGVKGKTSNASQVSLFITAGTNYSRALRTTTTQAPVAGDDMIVMGEHTGAGTGNSFVVTMNETATTDYGSNTNSTVTPAIAVCKRGTLSYGVAASTNYYLKLSGHLIVYSAGEFDIGTVGTEIPRNSTAVLEFDPAADGDMGLIARNGSICTIQGLSRTSGKDIVSCKLNADAPASPNLITTGIASNQGMTTQSNLTTSNLTQLGPDGISLLACGTTDNAVNGLHCIGSSGTGTVTNVTQVASVWLARGTGTNNRYVRLQYGNAVGALTNGFFADIDLQAGTIGSCTAVGNGTATSSSITAVGTGFVCTIIGKASSGALSPTFGLQACNASGGITYTGDSTQNFLYYGPQVFTAAALPSTTLSVDTDTGWLSGDVIAVASTSRTNTDCEPNKLSSAATSTTLPCQSVLTGGATIHSGTSPTQAEVILLTRNVKVRSSSPSIMAYVYLLSGSTANFQWAEFYYIGTNGVTKRGIEIEVNTTANINVSITFCSLHDGEAQLLYISTVQAASTLTNLIFSNNVTWLSNQVTIASVVNITSGITATNWTMDSNIVMRGSTGFSLADVGGTFTNNIIAGNSSTGLSITETSGVLGTWSGITIHSNAANSISFTGSGTSGTISTLTIWRNGGGVTFTVAIVDLILDTLVAFGNNGSNISLTSGSAIWLKNPTLNGDTSFATASGILTASAAELASLVIDNGDFSTVSGIKTAHTQDIAISIGPAAWNFVLRNTKLGATTEVANQSNLSNNGYIASEKHDQTAGNHKNWMRNGTLITDTTFFNNASPSMRMTPTSSTLKLESAPQFQGVKVAVANGATASISAYIRKSAVGDGAAYNGNQPRLIQKANPALGQNSDVVLATYASATGSWNQISGTTSSATDDGCWEIVVDCDGTAGWINVDDLAAA